MTIAKSRHIPVEIESRVYDRPVWRELGLTDWEYSRIVEVLGREPNWTELGMYSVLWSEHCAYKHSRLLFRLFPTQASAFCREWVKTQASSTSATGWR